MRRILVSDIVAVTMIVLMSFSIIQNVDGYDQKRGREVFLGEMHTEIPESMRLSFVTFSLIDHPINSTIYAKIGTEKIVLTGKGVIDVHYKDGDRQCKSVTGSQKFSTDDGKDGFLMIFSGKACHMGQNYKIFSGKFFGSEATGIFADKKISGTLTGTMDDFEQDLVLKLKAALFYDA